MELAPCPFCNCEAKAYWRPTLGGNLHWDDTGELHWIECSGTCEAKMSGFINDQDALYNWNLRYDPITNKILMWTEINDLRNLSDVDKEAVSC